MKYIVYLTTNLKSKVNNTNKIYIGVHKTENPDIFDGYLGCGVYVNRASTYMYPKTAFQYAVKKYGVNSFKRQILFIYDNPLDAFNKEKELVTSEFIKQPFTYNIAIGGIGGSLYKQLPEWYTKPLYQFDKCGNLVNKWKSTLEASEFYSEYYSKFDWAITDRYLFLDSYWSRTDKIDISSYSNKHKCYIYLYDKYGKLIIEFPSITSCALALDCKPQSISKAIKVQSTIKEYYVSKTLVDEFKSNNRIQLKNVMIYVYDVTGKFIGSGTGKEIMNIISLHSYKSIWSAIYSNCGWYKDYYLSLEKVEKVPEKLHNKHKKIDVFDNYGNFIETLDSIKLVKEKYNLNSAELNRILKGIKKHKNYIFQYSK